MKTGPIRKRRASDEQVSSVYSICYLRNDYLQCDMGVFVPGRAALADNMSFQQDKAAGVAATYCAAAGLGGILEGIPDEQERLDIIRAFIEPIRFFNDRSGYFYVYDNACVCVAHAVQKNIVMKDLYDHREIGNQEKQGALFFIGQADVIIVGKRIFQWWQKTLAGTYSTGEPVTYHNLFPEKMSFSVGFISERLRDEFDTGLQEIKDNGTYGGIIKRYVK